jgi:WD40 repeat protein
MGRYADWRLDNTLMLSHMCCVHMHASVRLTCHAYRYRNFRTMTTPEPVQLACVAIDRDGEVVIAGSRDSNTIFLWNLRTGQLLDVLLGHEAAVSAVAFNPSNATLASASWDHSVRVWTPFSGGKTATDVLQHTHEVLAMVFHPSGRYLACSTLNGEIHFWDTQDAAITGTIEVCCSADKSLGAVTGAIVCETTTWRCMDIASFQAMYKGHETTGHLWHIAQQVACLTSVHQCYQEALP